MLGVLLHHISDERIARLSRGENRRSDPAVAPMLVNFIVGGPARRAAAAQGRAEETHLQETEAMMKRRTLLSALAAASAAAALPVRAAAAPRSWSATPPWSTLPRASSPSRGPFKKRGLDVEFKIVPLNSSCRPRAIGLASPRRNHDVGAAAGDRRRPRSRRRRRLRPDRQDQKSVRVVVARLGFALQEPGGLYRQEGRCPRRRRLPAGAVPQLAPRATASTTRR